MARASALRGRRRASGRSFGESKPLCYKPSNGFAVRPEGRYKRLVAKD